MTDNQPTPDQQPGAQEGPKPTPTKIDLKRLFDVALVVSIILATGYFVSHEVHIKKPAGGNKVAAVSKAKVCSTSQPNAVITVTPAAGEKQVVKKTKAQIKAERRAAKGDHSYAGPFGRSAVNPIQ